ncbi:MAG TPA: four helix bundle protein, partial [Candidatus Eisenbacteria bacterium]
MTGDSGKNPIQSFEDLDVYRRLFSLHLEVNELTMQFPKYEMYELGAQIRRSSNSIPANLAEGWNNRHSAIYLESI